MDNEELSTAIEQEHTRLIEQFREVWDKGENGHVDVSFTAVNTYSMANCIMEEIDTSVSTAADDLCKVLGMLTRGEYQMAQAAAIRLRDYMAQRHADSHAEDLACRR